MPYTDNPDYDPDSPPADTSREFTRILMLDKSVRVDNLTDAQLFGADIGKAYEFMTSGTFARADGTPAHILSYHSLDSIRESDGQPLVYTEAIPLKSRPSDKNPEGIWLGKGQAPNKLAEQFNSLGVSASWNKVGEIDSAVGRVFKCVTDHEVVLFKRGKGASAEEIAKKFRVWPTAIEDRGYTYDGEIRTVPTGKRGATEDEPVASYRDFTLAQVATLLDGRPASEAFNVLIDSQVPGVVEGLPVLDMATADQPIEIPGLLQADSSGILRRLVTANA